jgi:hypothetical protein
MIYLTSNAIANSYTTYKKVTVESLEQTAQQKFAAAACRKLNTLLMA